MKYSQLDKYIILFCGICLLSHSSCRKKDKRYEGYYVGTESYTFLDSGSTEYSIDTTYSQEIDVAYSKNNYTFSKRLNWANQIFMISKEQIVDHEYQSWNAQGTIKFSGDSLYMNSSNFTDNIEYWDHENWVFKGKRN